MCFTDLNFVTLPVDTVSHLLRTHNYWLKTSRSKNKPSRIINYENNQQDALYRLIYYSKSALHVLGDVFAHCQEHLIVFRVSVNVHPSCCRLVSWMS
jgi:hypothetical protein